MPDYESDKAREEATKRAWQESLRQEPWRNAKNLGGDLARALLPDPETLQNAGAGMAAASVLGPAGNLIPWLDLDWYDRAIWDREANVYRGDSNPRALWEHTPQQIGYRNTMELVPTDWLWDMREYDRPEEYWKPIQESILRDGLREPLMIQYNPETQRAYLGEGNHRLAAMRDLGYHYAPARVVRSGSRPGAQFRGAEYERWPFSGMYLRSRLDPDAHVPSNLKPSQVGIYSKGLGDVVRTVHGQRPDLVSDEILEAYKLYGGVPADPELLRGAASAAGALVPGPVEAAGLTVPIAAAGQYERTQDPYEQLRYLSLHMKRGTLEQKDLAPPTLGLLLRDRELTNRLADEGLISSDLYQHLERKRAEHNY